MKTSGIILCGGRGRRLGGVDKGWLEYRGRPLVEQALGRIKGQVDDIVISANRNLDRYRALGYTVVSDEIEDYQGPLAGIAAALPHCHHDTVIVVACDMPLLPDDLTARLTAALASHSACFAWDGKREQYLASAFGTQAANHLKDYLARGERSVQGWFAELDCVRVDFSDCPERFHNINRLEDAAEPVMKHKKSPL